ncbi:hypothetical protein V474_05930 [Novosphingobium barchaimii LL02]|uniref:Uncharacterized protein n=1 Tax=Novosphingobium barchaimii LL02 TaxID=1114963 RepID=A0A0J7XFW0_9SPHN|nr:hypothetical protein V474_05930 [Novosphingobium barchaimii LL02]
MAITGLRPHSGSDGRSRDWRSAIVLFASAGEEKVMTHDMSAAIRAARKDRITEQRNV